MKKQLKRVKLLSVNAEGELQIHKRRVTIPQVKSPRDKHFLNIDPAKKEIFWDLDKKIAKKVATFRKLVKEHATLLKREHNRIMTNAENNVYSWFNNAITTTTIE